MSQPSTPHEMTEEPCEGDPQATPQPSSSSSSTTPDPEITLQEFVDEAICQVGDNVIEYLETSGIEIDSDYYEDNLYAEGMFKVGDYVYDVEYKVTKTKVTVENPKPT